MNGASGRFTLTQTQETFGKSRRRSTERGGQSLWRERDRSPPGPLDATGARADPGEPHASAHRCSRQQPSPARLRRLRQPPDHVRGWLEAQEQRGVTGDSRRVGVYALRSFYDWHNRDAPDAANPARQVHPPRQPGVRTDTYSAHQAERILAHAAQATDTHGTFCHALIATLRYTGLRNAELVSLHTCDIDLDAAELYVRKGKGRKARSLRIPPVLVRILGQYLKEIRPLLPESKYLFANPYSQANGGHIGRVAPRAVHHIVHRLGNDSGVPGDHFPHRWRHHYATSLIRAGVSLEHVRKLMGHASITTTARYIHLDNDDLATAVNNIFLDPHDSDHLT